VDVSWLDVVLLVGLAARLIRLTVVDTIAGPARDLVRRAGLRAAGDRGLVWADDLISCPFCIGWWISVGVVGSWLAAGGTLVWQAVAAAFTLSYVAGHLVAALDVDDSTEEDGP
jgi:hypothetical protein